MRKRNLQKAVVLVVCYAFLGLSASGLSAATTSQKPAKLTFSMLLKVPAQWLVALFPGLRNIINPDQPTQLQPPTSSSANKIRTTADIMILRPSSKD
ncbi:MAG: hypothetical protein ABSG19_07135 [Candidatus Aminicenantales bacterium]